MRLLLDFRFDRFIEEMAKIIDLLLFQGFAVDLLERLMAGSKESLSGTVIVRCIWVRWCLVSISMLNCGSDLGERVWRNVNGILDTSRQFDDPKEQLIEYLPGE